MFIFVKIAKKEFEWIKFEPIRTKLSSGVFQVERIPSEPKAYKTEMINDNTYRICINCPYCGYDNRFIYEKQ